MLVRRTLEELLLQLGLCDLDLDGLVNLLLVTALVIGIVFDGSGEQSVDEGSLAKTRLAGDLLFRMSMVVARSDATFPRSSDRMHN